ncbi:MAG: Two-component transcriptional response regulator PdtaR, LuxR family, partial [uncultured Acidimicrobiales bacterium]
GCPYRHRRGRGPDPARPQGDPGGRGLRGRGGRRSGRRGRRPGQGAPPGPGHPRHQDAGHGRHRRRPRDHQLAAGRGADPHCVQPARPGRAGPRRRRVLLPGQALPDQRPGAGDRGRAGPLCRHAGHGGRGRGHQGAPGDAADRGSGQGPAHGPGQDVRGRCLHVHPEDGHEASGQDAHRRPADHRRHPPPGL